jgi:hypothetical protein
MVFLLLFIWIRCLEKCCANILTRSFSEASMKALNLSESFAGTSWRCSLATQGALRAQKTQHRRQAAVINVFAARSAEEVLSLSAVWTPATTAATRPGMSTPLAGVPAGAEPKLGGMSGSLEHQWTRVSLALPMVGYLVIAWTGLEQERVAMEILRASERKASGRLRWVPMVLCLNHVLVWELAGWRSFLSTACLIECAQITKGFQHSCGKAREGRSWVRGWPSGIWKPGGTGRSLGMMAKHGRVTLPAVLENPSWQGCCTGRNDQEKIIGAGECEEVGFSSFVGCKTGGSNTGGVLVGIH